MPFDITTSQYKARVENPEHFKEGSFRTKELPSIKGISLITGKLKSSFIGTHQDPDAMVTQSIRFSRKYWTEKRAKDWLEKHQSLKDSQALYDDHRLGKCIDCNEFGALQDSNKKLLDKIIRVLKWKDFNIGIEVEKGDIRFPEHNSNPMPCSYGHFRGGYQGHDGDALDCYVGDNLEYDAIYRIIQLKEDKTFDEDKFMIGFKSKKEAKAIYLQCMPESFFGGIFLSDLTEIQDTKITDNIFSVINTEKLNDKVVSTIRAFRANKENDNNRAYSIKSSKRVIAELKSEIDQGLNSEVFDDHAQELIKPDGKIGDYDRREHTKVADLLDIWYVDDTNEAQAKIVWNEKTKPGAKLAKLAQDEETRKDIKFSIRGRLGKCVENNGIKVCDINTLYGVDKVEDPALDDAEILDTEVIQDSKNPNKIKSQDSKEQLIDSIEETLPASNCGLNCPCDDCQSSHCSIVLNNINIGDIPMFDAERLKKLHQVNPPLSWEQAKAIITGDGWYYTSADCEMAMAYWKEMDSENEEEKNEVEKPASIASPASTPVTESTVYDAEVKPKDEVAAKPEDKKPITDMEEKKKLYDADVLENTLVSFMKSNLAWDAVKEILANFPEIDLVAAEAKWKELENAKMSDKDESQDKENKGDTPVVDKKTIPTSGNNSLPRNNDQALMDKVNKLEGLIADMADPEMRALLNDRKAAKAETDFLGKVEAKLKDVVLTDSSKESIRQSAKVKYAKNPTTALDVVDEVIENQVRADKALVDARKAAMGYNSSVNGVQGHTIEVIHENEPGAEMFAKMNDIANEMLLDGTVKVEGMPNMREEIIRRKEQAKLLERKFLPTLRANFMGHNNNRERLTDAITTADLHGVSTVQNRETVLDWFTIQQTFYATTLTERIVRALAPGSPQQGFPMNTNKAANARPIDLGGVFVMNLETVSESGAALDQNYRIPRNAGSIWPVNTGLEHNLFATRSRMAGVTVDMENAAQMVTGALKYPLFVRAGLNASLALGRAIDTAVGEDMIATTREVGAVSVSAETPAGNGTTTGEWFYAAGGSAAGYGTNVVGVQSLLTGRPTTQLRTSIENSSTGYYPAPLVPPRTKTYVNGLTGATVDVILYPITVTIPGATAVVLGYLDKSTLRVEAINDGEYPNYAPDLMNARVCFTQGNGTSSGSNTLAAGTKPTVAYWYSTNHIVWSKANGRWNLATNTFISGFTSSTLLPDRARGFVNEVSGIGGTLGQEKQMYPNMNLSRFDFHNSYTAKAQLFENRMSPTDAELLADYGPSQVVCTDAGIVHVKTSNPRWSTAVKTVTNMGKAFSSLIGQTDYSFYGLGYVYPDLGMHRATRAPSGGGITQAVNAMMREMGFLDTEGTPVYADGRNYPHFELVIVD